MFYPKCNFSSKALVDIAVVSNSAIAELAEPMKYNNRKIISIDLCFSTPWKIKVIKTPNNAGERDVEI